MQNNNSVHNPIVVNVIVGGEGGDADGDCTTALLQHPRDIALGPDGTIYVADGDNNKIRAIARNGTVTTIASNVRRISGIAVGHDGTIYYSTDNHKIFYIQDGAPEHLAGTGAKGHADSEDARAAKFSYPKRLAVDRRDLLYVADSANHMIRVIKEDTVSSLAGTKASGLRDGRCWEANFQYPCGLAVSPDGRSIYVADKSNHCIRLVRDGNVTTVAGCGREGHDDGPAAEATFSFPECLALYGDVLFIGEMERIRVLKDGIVSTVLESGKATFSRGPNSFAEVVGLAVDAKTKSVIFADSENHRICKFIYSDFKTTSELDLRASLKLLDASLAPYGGETTIAFKTSTRDVTIHKSLLARRCPKLAEAKEPTKLDLSDAATNIFVDYMYSDVLPDNAEPEIYIGIGHLAFQLGMTTTVYDCLTHLEKQMTTSVPTLFKIVESTLKMCGNSFRPLLDLCYSKLFAHRKSISSKELRNLLKDFPNEYDYVVDLFISSDPPATSATYGVGGNKELEEGSLAHTLKTLYETREGADWEIEIEPTPSESGTQSNVTHKCHAFVLYARWPYFKSAFESNMKEKKGCKITLPCDIRKGGLTPRALEAILEVIYTNTLSPNTESELEFQDALSIRMHRALYQLSHKEAPWFASILDTVERICSDIDVDSAISALKFALEIKNEDVEALAKDVIIKNFYSLWTNADQLQALISFPHEVAVPLLQDCIQSLLPEEEQ